MLSFIKTWILGDEHHDAIQTSEKDILEEVRLLRSTRVRGILEVEVEGDLEDVYVLFFIVRYGVCLVFFKLFIG